jgi:hypothetical protein
MILYMDFTEVRYVLQEQACGSDADGADGWEGCETYKVQVVVGDI